MSMLAVALPLFSIHWTGFVNSISIVFCQHLTTNYHTNYLSYCLILKTILITNSVEIQGWFSVVLIDSNNNADELS